MVNTEALVEFAHEAAERGVAGMAARHDQMAGQRGLGRAHAPDMQIVDRGDPGQRREMGAHGDRIDPFRDGIEGETHRVLDQVPGAVNDHRRDDEADGGIEPGQPGQRDGDPGDDDAGRDHRVGRHVEKGASDVEIAAPAARE